MNAAPAITATNAAPVIAGTGAAERIVGPGEQSGPRVDTALTLERSAYGVKLLVTETGWTLVTAWGFYHQEGETPVRHVPAPLDPPFAVMGQEIVHWSKGQLEAAPFGGATPRPLVALPHMPRDVFASNDHFVWLERAPSGDRLLATEKAKRSSGVAAPHRVVYHTENAIITGAMLQDWVFFVEALPDGKWRLGAASINAAHTADKAVKAATLGAARAGRPPAFLLAANELYFYDGPTRSVRRVTPDLQDETIVATGVICSPLSLSERRSLPERVSVAERRAVSARIVCAQVGGVFSVDVGDDPATKSLMQMVDSHIKGPVTALAASAERVVWVEDLSGKQLRVQTARLP